MPQIGGIEWALRQSHRHLLFLSHLQFVVFAVCSRSGWQDMTYGD